MFNLKSYCNQFTSKAFPSERLVRLLILGMFFLTPSGGGVASAQNLVPNPSFEDTISCPIRPNGTTVNGFTCQNWYSASGNTWYFNGCAPHVITQNRNVPNNFPDYGWQYARTGVAYIGLQTYNEASRNFPQVELTDTLITQHKYCVEFYVNSLNNVKSASNNMGVYFSDLPIQYPNPPDFIGLIPQILDTTIITDTVNWIKITGEFIATGGEQYITIGNFFPDSTTDTLNINNNAGYVGTGYYIDDVSVWDCTGSGIGINEMKDENGIGVYPNPNEGVFEVMSTKYKMKRVAVYNVIGEKVYSKELKDINSTIINIDVGAGVYFLEVETEEGVMRKKFMKE